MFLRKILGHFLQEKSKKNAKKCKKNFKKIEKIFEKISHFCEEYPHDFVSFLSKNEAISWVDPTL